MNHNVFDSNLKLLGSNLARCHELISEALKVNHEEQNENICKHRVRRLCTSLERNPPKPAPKNQMITSTNAGKTVTTITGLKPNVNFKNASYHNKPNQAAAPGNQNRKVSGNTVSSSNHSKNLENLRIFSAPKNAPISKNNSARVPKARCPSVGMKSKAPKSKLQERQKPRFNVLREQNGTETKQSESDTDANHCAQCDMPGRLEGQPRFTSCNQAAPSNFSGITRVIGDSLQVDRSAQCMNHGGSYSTSNWNGETAKGQTASTFSIFNPVRTLHFLMQELQGKIFNLPDDTMKRILMDMEDTLQRIPPNNNYISPLTAENLQKADFQENEPPQKLSKLTTSVQELNKRMAGAGEKPCNENLQMKLELSCCKLEKACHEMEKACSELKKERDYYKNELHHKKKAFEDLSKKETSYVETINDLKRNLLNMTSKADEHTKSIENLNIVLDQLQEENKVVCSLKDLHKKLNSRLRETTQENERLKADLQLVTLEREKLTLILASRDNELTKFKQAFGEVQEYVSDQLLNASMKKDLALPNCNFSALSIDSCQPKETNAPLPTPDSNNLTNSKSSTCLRGSVPAGWHVMNSNVTDSTALRSGNRTSSTDQKKNNLIDSIRNLLSEMKQDHIVDIKQSVPDYNTIEKYDVPQLSDTSVSSQKSGADISQLSSLSTLTL